MAINYQKEVDQILPSLKIQRVFTVSNLKWWSLPDLDTLAVINAINKKVQESTFYQHKALITPSKNKDLFLDIDQQFQLSDTQVESRAFTNLKDALLWGKSLGYQFPELSDDHLKLHGIQ